VEKLDDYCSKILSVLFLEKPQAHYNELYRLILDKLELKRFSKPTYNTHLKHLVELGFVKRTQDKGQSVTYSLNPQKIGRMKEFAERVKRIVKYQTENMRNFFSMSEKEQIDTLFASLCYRKLHEIDARIVFEQEPDSFEKWFILRFYNIPMLEQLSDWVVKRCAVDEDYRNSMHKFIKNYLRDFDNAISK